MGHQLKSVAALATYYTAVVADRRTPRRDALLASIEQRLWEVAPVGVDRNASVLRPRRHHS